MKNKGFTYMLGRFVGAVAFVCICTCILGVAIGGVVAISKLLNWLWFI